MVHEQVTEEPVLPGQSLPASVIGDSGGRGQDLFGADAQGAGGGAFFRLPRKVGLLNR